MTVTTGGRTSSCSASASLPCRPSSIWFSLQQLGAVAQLLDHQHRGIALDRLIDGRHDPEVHQHLDDLGGLDRHALGELGHRDGLAERHLALDRRGGHLETVLGLGADGGGPRLEAFLLLVPRADVAGDVQLLAAIARALLVVLLFAGSGRGVRGVRRMRVGGAGCASARPRRCGAALALGFFGRALLGEPARFLLRLLAGLFLLDAATVLGLEPLALAPLRLRLLALRALGFLGLALLRVDLLLLRTSLPFEHIALDVGALRRTSTLTVRARPWLLASLSSLWVLRLKVMRLGAEPSLPWPWLRRRCVSSSSLASSLIMSSGLDTRDARLVELCDQAVHRTFRRRQIGRSLHQPCVLTLAPCAMLASPRAPQCCASNQCARAFMMRLPASSR